MSDRGKRGGKGKAIPKPHDAKEKPKQSSKPASEENTAGDVAKRPDTRTLIAGSSWTGKLPVNLLSEHCQRSRWEKPEYSMVFANQMVGVSSTLTSAEEESERRLRILSHPEACASQDQGDYGFTTF